MPGVVCGVVAAVAAALLLQVFAVGLYPPPTATIPGATLGFKARLKSRNLADFDGGNIGGIRREGRHAFALQLRSDNDDALPAFWRQWWYLKLDDVATDQVTKLTLRGAGQWHYYLPFYSYDNKTWHQFEEREVAQPSRLTLTMQHRFTRGTVWLARYVPYTTATLDAFLKRIRRSRDVTVGSIGRTPEGRSIPSITIGDARTARARVVLHARTHPGEVGSSFLLEGLVDFLLSGTPEARRLRQMLVFDIVPMLNIDGVFKGNNRVTPRGVNLEGKWYADAKVPLALDRRRAPPEVQLLHARLRTLLRSPVPITMALNLHASGGTPEDNVFFFPHFGPASAGYNAVESRLFKRQIDFIDGFRQLHGSRWFNTSPADGGRAFASRSLPESWWWRNFQDRVMALTIESAYGKAGPHDRWIKPEDMRALGRSLGRAIGRYHQQGDRQRPDIAAH